MIRRKFIWGLIRGEKSVGEPLVIQPCIIMLYETDIVLRVQFLLDHDYVQIFGVRLSVMTIL